MVTFQMKMKKMSSKMTFLFPSLTGFAALASISLARYNNKNYDILQ